MAVEMETVRFDPLPKKEEVTSRLDVQADIFAMATHRAGYTGTITLGTS